MTPAAILRATNDVDVIEEFMDLFVAHFPYIYLLDDSNDGTGEIIQAYSEVVWAYRIDYLSDQANIPRDHPDPYIRLQVSHQIAMDEIIAAHGDKDTWITNLFSDIVFYHCPIQLIQRAEYFGYTAILWHPIHFFLSSEQRDNWLSCWATLPVMDRLKWYCPGDTQIGWSGAEVKQFKPKRGLQYNFGEGYKDYPKGTEKRTNPVPYPLYLHMGYRFPEQIRARTQHNIDRGFNVDHRGMDQHIFVERLEGFREACKFTDSFGSREIPDLYRYWECGHGKEE